MANNKAYLWACVALCVISFSGCTHAADEENEISKARAFDARAFLGKIASTLMSRSGSSSSQVLSLNLSNLLILVLLKALIFAAGSVGAGGWKGGSGYGHGRSSDETEDRIISDSEILLYLGYLSSTPGQYQCLQNVACNRPQQAAQYAKAGGLLLKAARIMPNAIDVNPVHEETLQALRKAAEFGQSGGNCDAEFVCENKKKKK